MATFFYASGLAAILDGTVDLTNDTIKALLMKDSHTEDRQDDFVSDIVADECDATGYVGGHAGADRLTLTMSVLENSPSTDEITIDADNVTWTALGGASNNTLEALVIYKEGASDAASQLLIYVDFASNKTTDGNDLPVVFGSNGIITIDVNP